MLTDKERLEELRRRLDGNLRLAQRAMLVQTNQRESARLGGKVQAYSEALSILVDVESK